MDLYLVSSVQLIFCTDFGMNYCKETLITDDVIQHYNFYELFMNFQITKLNKILYFKYSPLTIFSPYKSPDIL